MNTLPRTPDPRVALPAAGTADEAAAAGSAHAPAAAVAASRRRAGARVARRERFLVHAGLALAWCALLVLGWPYYRLAPEARLQHPWHTLLKPAGTIGLAYGYLGTTLLLLLFLYSVRKRWRPLRRLGVLRKWLSVHIACGILGPGFITLHAGLKVQGLIAVGYWAMICVLASGFVGFYIYSQLPRALAGHATESELLRAEIDALDRELGDRFGLAAGDLEALRRASGADRAERLGPLQSLFFLLGQDLSLALGLRRVQHRGLRRHGRAETHRLRDLVRRRVLVERRRAFLRQTEVLFGYWHAMHKPFAIVLYLMMAVHVGVAIWLGYAWVW